MGQDKNYQCKNLNKISSLNVSGVKTLIDVALKYLKILKNK